MKNIIGDAGLGASLKQWMEKASALPNFDQEVAIEKSTREVADALKIEAKKLIHPLRFAISGETVTPGLFELMSVLGKEKCLERVERFVNESL